MLDVDGGPHGHASVDELSHTRMMLDRLAGTWGMRAQVKKRELEPMFEDGREDFLESLLPFKDMPQYLSCPPELKSRILSCGWLMYNAKTTQIETEIVNPVCHEIMTGQFPGLLGESAQHAVCETMVDEVYHVHLVERASRFTRRQRGLDGIVIPTFNLVEHMRRRQEDYGEPWQRRMVQFATAAVSEIFISDYLHLLSESPEIQPFNRMTVAAHRHDELVHGPLFRSLTHAFTAELTGAERETLAEILPEPVIWFADRELDIWLALLQQLGFVGAEAMIAECRSLGTADVRSLDYSGVVSLAEELELLDAATARDSFARRGLVT